MIYGIPDDRRYLESHEWAAVDGDTARIGISDFAPEELGDVVFVELPPVGNEVEQAKAFGVVESIKAVSDLYAPVSGTVTLVNDELERALELVNTSPYDEGWLLEVELADVDEFEGLLRPAEYGEQIE